MRSTKSKTRLSLNEPKATQRLAFDAIGTAWAIDIFSSCTNTRADALQACVLERIAVYDAHYSRFRDDSLIAKMATKTGTYVLPDDARPLFDIYQELYHLTGGVVTPLIGQTLSDAGYDAVYSLQPKAVQSPPAWEDVLHYDYPQLTLRRPALLDVGAAGKGYLVDIVSRLLEEQGVDAYCVDAGGDMLYCSQSGQSLRVGLEHPDNTGQVLGVAAIYNQSLCGSAGNRRAWGTYHHIMNAHTATSPRHIKAVWVTAASGLVADALTTALFFVPAQKLAGRYTFEYAVVYDDYALERSPGFEAEFFMVHPGEG